MLYHLFWFLHERYPSPLHFLRVTGFQTTRILLGTLTALLLGLFLGPWFIRKLRYLQISEQIRDDGPSQHKKKAGTPTMGGSFILFCLFGSSLLWCDLTNRFVWITIGVTLSYGLIGFLDDYRKLKVSKKGVPGKIKLLLQVIFASILMAYLFFGSNLYIDGAVDIRFRLSLPLLSFDKYLIVLPSWLYFIFGVLMIVGFSNAVNLTDGLDGLAIGPSIISAGTFLVLVYAAGGGLLVLKQVKHPGTLPILSTESFSLAEYLHIPPIKGIGELSIFCGALMGAGIGFLWYNAHPAQVFMGDVGSLSIGGALGTIAVLSKNEITLLILGGIFVIETVSVILQVASFKITGKRIFRMTPIHHHFELKGWAEPKIIVRFWIISIILAILALATLKVR